MNERIPTPEFSRVFPVGDLGEAPANVDLEASDEERGALRARFGVDELKSLRADLVLSASGARGIKVTGTVSAHLVQACVVSLDPVEERIEEEVAITYLPEGAEDPAVEEGAVPDGEEVDSFDGEGIDLGELVTQQVALAIDPYPRKEGAEFGKADALADNGEGARENPFAVLKGFGSADGAMEDG